MEIILGMFTFLGIVVALSIIGYFIALHSSKGWHRGKKVVEDESREKSK